MQRVLLAQRSWLVLMALGFSVLILFLSSSFLASINPIQAQEGGVAPGETVYTNPKNRDNSVSATVPDNQPPTTPILISPSNNSILTDNTPSFIWEAASDDLGISKYVLYIDGSTYFDDIPLSDTSNANYVLSFDSGSNRYTLTPTAPLSDGTHTWKVQVWDNSSHSTDSVTWTFTIDSRAPNFVISQIGTAAVAISAQDISTIPSSPLVLTANEPLIVATGEPNSLVQTTLVIPGYPTQNFSTSIDAAGNWSLQIGILPRDLVMTLSFLITDIAGNVSVLNNVDFLIEQTVIVFPPVSPSPSPSVMPEASPQPGASPTPGGSPVPTPSTPPTSPLPTTPPLFVIPITPPRETLFTTIQSLIRSLPTPVQVALDSLSPMLAELAPVSALFVAATVPLVSTLAVASQFGGSLSPTLLIKILQALGLIPVGKPQGLVFNSQTDEGVPFAVLTFRSRDPANDLSIVETVVTDSDGIYKGINLPAGTYQIEVSQQEYHFPTKHNRPRHLSLEEYYRGEVFNLGDKQEPLFLIPMDPLVVKTQAHWRLKVRLALAQLARKSSIALFPLAFLSTVLLILYPTIWNWIVFGLYLGLIGRRVVTWFKVPVITGQVIDEQGHPMSNVIVRLTTVEENSLAAVMLTNEKGEFAYYGQSTLYQLSLQKPGYVWMSGTSSQSFYEVDVRVKKQHVLANLTPLNQLDSSLFSR